MTIARRRGGAQQRQQRLGESHLGIEVDGHGSAHVLVAAIGEARAPGGAGVVDEQIEAAVTLEQMVVDARWRIVVEQVHSQVAHTLLPKLSGERTQTLLAAGDEHQRGAGLAREPARGRLTDSAGGTGDEHDGAVVGVMHRLCHRSG